MKKAKYEKPISIDAGQVAAVQGASCSDGGFPYGRCSVGANPDVGPVCQPGTTADFNCNTGSTVTAGNCSAGGTANGNCGSGTSATGACFPTGSSPGV